MGFDELDEVEKKHNEQYETDPEYKTEFNARQIEYTKQREQFFEQELNNCIKAGRYTLELASIYIARNSRTDERSILETLMESVREGKLKTYAPGSDGPYKSKVVREFYEEVFWDDLNSWLKNNWPRLGCSFPNPDELAKQAQASGNGQLNWNDWLGRKHLSLDELLLLSLEENPDDKDLSFFGSIGLNDDETYIKRRNEAEGWIRAELLQAIRVNNHGSIAFVQIAPVCFFTLAKSKEWDLAQEIIDFLHERRSLEAETVEGNNKIKNESRQTKEWKAKARKIGEQWMKAERNEGRDPGVIKIAKYLEGELSNQNIRGSRGKFLDWETIKREALTGITGKQPSGKRKKA
jgi:hypothetical protein